MSNDTTTRPMMLVPTFDAEIRQALTNVRVGDPVRITEGSNGRRVSEARVTKITRQSIIIERYRSETKFDIETGTERRGANAIGYAAQLESEETAAMTIERGNLLAELHGYGIEINRHAANGPGIAALRALLSTARMWSVPK